MDESTSDLLLWGALAAAGALLAWWHVANDVGDAAAKRQRVVERRLAGYPASAGAVIIKAQPRRALWQALPLAALAVAVMLATPYVKRNGLGMLCDHLGIAEAARWIAFMCFPGLAVLLTLLASFEFTRAIRVLRGGYAPPLNTVLLHDAIAVTGWRARLQGITSLVMLPLMLGTLAYLTYNTRQSFVEARLQAAIAAQCSTNLTMKPGKGQTP